jgi:hypothetical protein
MSEYTKATNFTAKDSLATGNAAKLVKGSEFDTEFNAIQTAVGTKANKITGGTNGAVIIQDAGGDLDDSGYTFTSTDDKIDNFPVGTLMLFQQTAAPTGWTKQTTHNDKALRVVSGTASSGGTTAFTTIFTLNATETHALSIGELPAHTHTGTTDSDGAHTHIAGHNYGLQQGSNTHAIVDNSNDDGIITSSNGAHTHTFTTDSTGSGTAHSHDMDLRVQYVDIIIAAKD